MSYDKTNPEHYKNGPSKCPNCQKTIEAITVTEQMNFNLGNTIKYIWRAGKKPGAGILEDLEKAHWYLTREIERLTAEIVESAVCSLLDSEPAGYACESSYEVTPAFAEFNEVANEVHWLNPDSFIEVEAEVSNEKSEAEAHEARAV